MAKCCPMAKALSTIRLRGNRSIYDIKRHLLNPSYSQAIVPFPPLPYVIPVMAANLRDLDLILIDHIRTGEAFSIVASIDSPFRELVS